jgi:hypothetical protein
VVLFIFCLVAGCTSEHSTVGGTQSLPSVETSAASTDWDGLPIATLPRGRFTYGLAGDICVMEVVGDGEGGLVIMTPDGTNVSRVPIVGGGYPVAWVSPTQILLVSAEPGDEARWGVDLGGDPSQHCRGLHHVLT